MLSLYLIKIIRRIKCNYIYLEFEDFFVDLNNKFRLSTYLY